MKEKTTPEQEHRPEFIQEIESEADQDMHPALKYIVENIILIGIGVGLIILSVAAYSGFNYYQANKSAKMQEQLTAIVAETNSSQQIAQLEKFLKEGPGKLKTQALFSLAGQQLEQKEYAKAAATWANLTSSPNREVSIIASLGQAKCFILSDEPAKAIPVLEKIKDKAGEPFKMTILSNIALAAEKSENWEKALSIYQEMKDSDMGVDPAYVDYKLSVLRAKLNKNDSPKVG